ncbi:hypothetical protein MOV66_02590 [Agrobacterium sp. SHOUNA12C]|nr:hypothetical protein [Agrobacterium sp. BETTINA12B]MCJ9755521.1 hypothetical protein [Agrobacterium sp. SHOUNA12C]NTG34771.1 hypothetical protein [Rhizobium rhizogenes]NTG54020.1 hypothetical protein [Rhizobium rhizogenes]
MQTPFDTGHWVGERHETVDEAADAYIRRCYEVGLEGIALTEHNFVSKDVLPVFQLKAKELAKEFGYELIVFPGFEFTANVGKGVHVLAIFEPGADLNQIDHILTECGVGNPRRTAAGQHVQSKKALEEIIQIVQAPNENGGKKGLIILPHIQSNSGMFDDSKIAEWLQQREFTNADLLAVEVPKSPSKMSEAFQKLFGNGDDCHVDWRRTRSVCCVMSSDAKSLHPNDKTANAIGSKYTWIKMSAPSIEALRQAFLDHESRVRRSDEYPDRPELQQTHPYIESIEIRGVKFLADQNVVFSRSLNTLIGGRGTGKSTMIEYLRLALCQEGELEADRKSQLYEDFQNVRDTLSPSGSLIKVVYNKGTDFKNQKLTLTVETGKPLGIDPELGDINTYLPVRIYSRGQIEAIANDPQKQTSIIDDLIQAPLEGLKNEERDIVRQLRDLNESFREEAEIINAKGKLVADISNLKAQIEAIKAKHSKLEDWSKWNSEKQFLSGLETSAQALVDNATKFLTNNSFSYREPSGTGDNIQFLQAYRASLEGVLGEMQNKISASIQEAKSAIIALAAEDGRVEWQKQFALVDAENKKSIAELEQLGIKFDAYDELLRRLEIAQAQLAAQDERIAEIAENRTRFQSLYADKLLAVWQKQYELRQGMASQLNQQVTKTKIGTPTVKTEITKHGDFISFLNLMATHHRDKRVVSQVDWETILKTAFDLAAGTDISPVNILESWMETSVGGAPEGFPRNEVQPKKLAAIAEWLTENVLNELKTHRIADAVTVTLQRREDGKTVGDLVGRRLSAGQKATTVLSLLLAEGTSPIIIDQPEDDLDNEFVFEQLVPMLRSSKEKRQIIVVTHNANVPVNGDAELIVPLEVRNSQGTQKIIDRELTVGALDKPPVQRAVELILEGSSEAFRRRREKYGV